MVDKGIIEEFVSAITPAEKKTNTVHSAVVSRIDDEGVVWVHVAGSKTETPTELTASEVKRGDSVHVEWRNNKLYIAGNYSNPSAGVVRVEQVENATLVANKAAEQAASDAEIAKGAAESAVASATQASQSAQNASEYASRALNGLSSVQSVAETLTWITQHGTMTLTTDTALDPSHVYFVQDNSGDYVVGNVHYAIVSEPDVADISTYYELSIDESLNNYVATHLAVDGEGLWLIPDTGGNKVLIATGAGTSYTSAGTYIISRANGADTVLAQFGVGAIQIGQNDQTRAIIDYHSMKLIDKEGNTYFHVSDLRNADGTITDKFTGDGTTVTFMTRVAVGNTLAVTVNGAPVVVVTTYGASFTLAQAPPNDADVEATYTPQNAELVKGYSLGIRKSESVIGAFSSIEGYDLVADGNYSHAEGYMTTATGRASHTEGELTKALKAGAHAEGELTIAQQTCSHAEGWETISAGIASHAGGRGTCANKNAQRAIGTWNTIEPLTSGSTHPSGDTGYGTKVLIIGNGTDDNARSNALTVDWKGNISRYTGWDGSTIPSANIQSDYVTEDTDGNWTSHVTSVVYGSASARAGQVSAIIGARHPDAPNTPNNIGIYVDGNGAMNYTISSPANFRSALGIAVAVTEVGSSNGWVWRKYSDKTFDAWYSGTATTAINSAVGSLYQSSSNLSLSIPSGIGATSVLYGDVNLFTSSYGVWTYIITLNSATFSYRGMSALSRASASYTVKAYVRGAYS